MNPMPHNTRNRRFVSEQLARIGLDYIADRLVNGDAPTDEPISGSEWRCHAVAPLKDSRDDQAWRAGEILDRCIALAEKSFDGFEPEASV